jgi:uncharacterized protein
MEFRWNAWNIDHIAEHGVEPQEADAVVRNARKPYPRYHQDGKWLARGRGSGGRLLQVIFVVDEDDKIFVIHSRPLTDREK